MENTTAFTYEYSAQRNREVEKIRSKYLKKEENKLEALRCLDARAGNAGVIESLVIGIIGCLIFGIGMCFGTDVFAGGDWLTVLFIGMGIATMIPAYPVYRRISRRVKDRLSPEILKLSEEIINGKNNED